VIYYREPCNPSTTGVDDDTVWSRYVPPEGLDEYFDTHLDAVFKGMITPGDRAPRRTLFKRLFTSCRIVIKEVAAFPSIEWLYLRWRPRVLMIVRHPAACALSVRDAGLTSFEPARLHGLVSHPVLREQFLAPFLRHLATVATPLETSAAIWAIKNFVAFRAREKYPEWKLLRYETMCADPVSNFRSVYESMGMRWSDQVESWVRSTTEASEPGTYTTSRVAARQIDSWRKKLSESEITQVRRIVEPFNLPVYYDSSSW
jgi:hypothetical protein